MGKRKSCTGLEETITVECRRSRGLYRDVAHINLVEHHVKTVSIAYIYDVAIIHSYRDIMMAYELNAILGLFIHSFIHHREH